MERNIKSKALKGVKWTSLNTLFTAISSPLYQVILALLLAPQEFAYIAVISLFIGISKLFSDVGISEAVIQKEYVNANHLSSLFYFNVLITLIIATTFYMLAPEIQRFYNLEYLDNFIKLLIITVISNGISSIFRVYLQRNLLFKDFSIIQITKTSLDIISTILFILTGFGIVGYVYGTIFSSLIYALILIKITVKKTDIKILLYFNIRDVLPFLNFGVSISLKKILTYLSQRLDEVIVGGGLSADILGVYYFGKKLILELQSVLTNSFSQVLLPIFSKIKKNRLNLKNAYLKITNLAAMIGFPVFVGVALTSHLFVPVIFGDNWLGSIEVIRILSLAMIIQVLTANLATSILYSINKPNLVLVIDVVCNIIYLSSLALLSSQGIIVILVIYSTYTIIKAITLQYFVGKELNFKFSEYILQLKKIIFSTILMALVIKIIQIYALDSLSELTQLIISVLIGVFIFITAQWVIDRKNMIILINMLKREKRTNDNI